jgi:hypothetical protein
MLTPWRSTDFRPNGVRGVGVRAVAAAAYASPCALFTRALLCNVASPSACVPGVIQ